MEQNRNTSRNRYITHDGRTQTASEWARELGIPNQTFAHRLNRWSLDRAIREPHHPRP
jgi:hypothetical protein